MAEKPPPGVREMEMVYGGPSKRIAQLEAELAQVRAQLEKARWYEHRTARKLDDLLAAVEEHEQNAHSREPWALDADLYAVARRIKGDDPPPAPPPTPGLGRPETRGGRG